MKDEKRYCFHEADSFPADEFFYDEEGNLIHKAGKKSNWHNAGLVPRDSGGGGGGNSTIHGVVTIFPIDDKKSR